MAGSLKQLGELLLAEGDSRRALDSLGEALALYRETGNKWAEADVLAKIAKAREHLGDQESALDELRQAIALNPTLGNRSALAENHYETAQIERSAATSKEPANPSRWPWHRRLHAPRGRRGGAAGPVLRHQAGRTTTSTSTCSWPSTTATPERGTPQRRCARASTPAPGASSRPSPRPISTWTSTHPEVLRDSQSRDRAPARRQGAPAPAANRAAPGSRRARPDRTTKPAAPEAISRIELDLERLLNQLQGVERQIRISSPRYAALTRPQSVSVEEIQRSLLDEQTTLLEFSLGAKRSFLWAVTTDRFESFELPRQAVLEGDARCLHWLLTQYKDPPPRSDISERGRKLPRRTSRGLRRWLGQPADSHRSQVAEGDSARPTRPSRLTSPRAPGEGGQGRHAPPSPGRSQRRRPPVRPPRRPARSRPRERMLAPWSWPTRSCAFPRRRSWRSSAPPRGRNPGRAARSRSSPTRCTTSPTHACTEGRRAAEGRGSATRSAAGRVRLAAPADAQPPQLRRARSPRHRRLRRPRQELRGRGR